MPDVKTVLSDIASAIKYMMGEQAPETIAPIDFADQILDIPVEHGGYSDPTPIINGTVKTVSNSASFTRAGCLAYCDKLTTANLSNCITVGSSTFASCYKLRAVHLENCKTIYENAFLSCSKLSRILLPVCEVIGSRAFSQAGLSTIVLPMATSIYNNAFEGNSQLETVELPVASYLYPSAFCGCNNLKNVSMPNMESIDNYAFSNGCLGAGTIYAPKLKTIGAYAF